MPLSKIYHYIIIISRRPVTSPYSSLKASSLFDPIIVNFLTRLRLVLNPFQRDIRQVTEKKKNTKNRIRMHEYINLFNDVISPSSLPLFLPIACHYNYGK